MPQISIPYAIGRIRVRQGNALDMARLDRLISAPSFREAQRALAEIGYAGGDSADYEKVAEDHVEAACRLVRDLTTAPAITDCYLLPYDVHNLKTLVKARHLHEKVDFLSGCGTIPVAVLEHAVADHSYGALPEILQEAMNGLEKRMAVAFDPLDVDMTLDKALYAMVFAMLGNQGKKAEASLNYFTAKVDFVNAMMLLRIRVMGKDHGFLRSLLVPGGRVSEGEWEKAFEAPERLLQLLKPYGKEMEEALRAALQSRSKLPLVEKAADNYLLSIFTPYKMRTDTLEPLIGYLLAAQREAAAVRLIMAAKANGFDSQAISERMRDLYGR